MKDGHVRVAGLDKTVEATVASVGGPRRSYAHVQNVGRTARRRFEGESGRRARRRRRRLKETGKEGQRSLV